jgi:hypothetical protein
MGSNNFLKSRKIYFFLELWEKGRKKLMNVGRGFFEILLPCPPDISKFLASELTKHILKRGFNMSNVGKKQNS